MKRTFIAAALALSVGAAFANPDAVVIGAGGAGLSDDRGQYSAC